MKRLFLILLFFSAFLLFSCRAEYGILDYQEKDIVAECMVNGKYKVEIQKTQNMRKVTVLEPQNARGISFEIGERAYALYGETKIEIEKAHLDGICALAEIFSQSEECLTTAKEQGGGSVLTFQNDTCVYKITFGEHSLPKHIYILSEGFEYNIDILSIDLK
ncbi:MAG: hypothetical protein J6B45_02000 [Clostridia bacterium]|nr:hypothetical protein [Clostridia bacterium]